MEAVEAVLDLTETTRDVEDSHIGTRTRKNYIRTCIDFIVFLFDSHPSLLVHLEELRAANAIDLLAPLPVQRGRTQATRTPSIPPVRPQK